MKYPAIHQNHSEAFKTAVRRFESGLYEAAGTEFLALLEANPRDADAAHFLRLVHRRLGPFPPSPVKLIWQFNPTDAWERDWLHLLLGDTVTEEVVDNTWSVFAPRMIVVDNRLVEAKLPYYRAAFERGCRIVLVHLSDEAFRDDIGAYRYCEAVIRNYHSEVLAEQASVHFFPLGYKAAFPRPGQPAKPAAARKYLWSFAGDAKKFTRATMMDAMKGLPDGFSHMTAGFDSADCLAIDAYRALLDETVVVPCPSGWSNLETFRVYEALEAGCIPILEKRPGFDYFTALLGPHPMPTIMTWAEGAALVAKLKDNDSLEPLRLACSAWWADYKPRLAGTLQMAINQAFALPPSPRA